MDYAARKNNCGATITTLPTGARIVIDDPAKAELQNITVANLLADIQFAVTVINKVTATETSIAAFAAASAGYTFQKGDFIELAPDLNENVAVYYYNGGTKTVVGSYDILEMTKTTWASLLNVPFFCSDGVNYQIMDSARKLAIDFDGRTLNDTTGEEASINWGTRQLSNNSGDAIYDWQNQSMPNLPIYADNAAALAGNLTAGQLYKTATGELRIVV